MLGLLIPTGGNAFLGENGAALRRLELGLGWDTAGLEVDLDASAFLLAQNGKVSSDRDVVFYNARRSICGSVEHHGDSQQGGSGGDDERISMNLERIPPHIQRVAITVTIHQAGGVRRRFSQLRSAYIRVINKLTGTEIMRYQLENKFGQETALIFAEVYRHQAGWKFRAVGQGFAGGLEALCRHFGVTVDN